MKKKDKVTLKGVDKPEPFQHWTETINGRKAIISYQDLKTSEVPVFNISIDPYHIEPIDNPQKTSQTIVSDTINDLNRIYENMFSKDLLEQMKYYTPDTIVKEKTPEDVMLELKAIKMFYPEVLEQFIKEHYGK